MHDGGSADVLSFPAKPRQQSETIAVERQLDAVFKTAAADQLRADVVSIAYRHTLKAASSHVANLAVAMLAIDPKHVAAFDGELKELYNYSFSLMNRIRASYGLQSFVAPGIPFDPLHGACAHPDVCTCGRCQDLDQTVPSHLENCGNE